MSRRSFGALKVTDAVSLSVPRGQALGVIGPNGAGKSTLFNLITGNLLPDAGRITLLGRDVTRAPAMERVRMGVGRSFQIPQPFEGLTVLENLLTAAVFGRGAREAEVTEDCVAILRRDRACSRKANTSPARSACSTASGSSLPAPWRPGRSCCFSTRSRAG